MIIAKYKPLSRWGTFWTQKVVFNKPHVPYAHHTAFPPPVLSTKKND